MRGGAVVSKTDLDKSCAGISLSPDDAEVAVATDSGIYIFALNGNDLEQTNVIDKPRGAVTCVEYSHDGASLASADAARDVFIFDRFVVRAVCCVSVGKEGGGAGCALDGGVVVRCRSVP